MLSKIPVIHALTAYTPRETQKSARSARVMFHVFVKNTTTDKRRHCKMEHLSAAHES